MTRAEAGRLGGRSTAIRYGRDYMRAIGRNGGLLGGRPTWQETILLYATRAKAKAGRKTGRRTACARQPAFAFNSPPTGAS